MKLESLTLYKLLYVSTCLTVTFEIADTLLSGISPKGVVRMSCLLFLQREINSGTLFFKITKHIDTGKNR